MKFKVGDRVKYVSENYSEARCNPLWGGRFGYVVGVIAEIQGEFMPSIYVEWDNGTYNSYGEEDLELAGCPNSGIIIKED